MADININSSAAGQAGPFAARALQLFKMGYNPVLLAPRDKKPFLPGWTKYNRIVLGKEDLQTGCETGFLLSENLMNSWASKNPRRT